ncbi:MAG: hypothetical protein ACOC33_02565 [bacterium]
MNTLMHGTQLAKFQDNLIKKLQKRYEYNEFVNDSEIRKEKQLAKEMSKNLWVKTARRIAPNNLVLRHYCLIDILNGSPDNYKKIYDLINHISPLSPNGRLWLEGYTYWLYCKGVLHLYTNIFNNKYRANVSIPLSLIINEIDNCFQKISYPDNFGFLYPSPFGSLRYSSLENHLQDDKMNVPNINIYPVKKMTNETIKYEVKKSLLGFNTHVPDKTTTVTVGKAMISNFKFYTGYENKYKSKWQEIKDTFLRIDRILSAIKLLVRG